jgi:hypothetical protein
VLIATSWWFALSTAEVTVAASSSATADRNSETDVMVDSHCVSCGSREGDQAVITCSGTRRRCDSSTAQAKASAAALDPSVPTTRAFTTAGRRRLPCRTRY